MLSGLAARVWRDVDRAVIAGVDMQGIRITPIDAALSKRCLDLASAVFARSSVLHRALGISADRYRDQLHTAFARMIDEGLSLAAIDQPSGEIAGCIIVTDFHSAIPPAPDGSDPLAPVTALTRQLALRYKELRPLPPGKVILIDMAAVAEAHGGRGIYRGLRNAAQARAKALGYQRVVGELSSAATQHVVLKHLGHENLAEIAYRDFTFQGDQPFSSIAEPHGIILAEGKL